MNNFLERIYDEDRKRVIKGLSFSKRKKLRVMPVPQTGGWHPRNSEGDGLKNRANVRFTVPFNNRSKTYLDPLSHLTDEQKDELALKLGLNEGGQVFNPLKPGKDNYWKNRAVILDGNGMILETDNPAHYVDACILLSNYEYIAASWSSRKDKGTYMYALVDEAAESKEKKKVSQVRVKAHNLFNEIHESSDKLESVLWIRHWEKRNYLQPPDKPNYDYLFSAVEEMVHDSPNDFIDIVGDGKFEVKADIVKGLKYGVLKRKGQSIMFATADTPIGTFGETVEYFASDAHADDMAKLTDLLEEKKNKK